MCPVKIEIPKLLLKLRSEVTEAKQRQGSGGLERLAFRMFAWVMTHPKIYLAGGTHWRDTGAACAAGGSFEEVGQPADRTASSEAKLSSIVGREEAHVTSRDQILADIRTALGRSTGQKPVPLTAPLLRGPRFDRDLYVPTFVQRFEKLAGKAFVVPDAAAVVPQLSSLLDGKRVVASNAPFLKACGITGLCGGAIRIYRSRCAAGCLCRSRHRNHERRLRAGGNRDAGDVRRAVRRRDWFRYCRRCMWPSFPQSRILANLDQLLTVVPMPSEQPSSMVLITGPSRTADIEQILVRGVHGPGEIYAIVVEDEIAGRRYFADTRDPNQRVRDAGESDQRQISAPGRIK